MIAATPNRNGPVSPFETDNGPGTVIYTVDLGNGHLADIEGPAGATPEQLQQVLASNPQLATGAPQGAEVQGGFADELPDQPASKLPPEIQQQFISMLQGGASKDQLLQFLHDHGGFVPTNLDDVIAYRDRTGQVVPDVTYSFPTVSEADTGGKVGAGARGAGDSLTLGLADKAHSLVQAIKDQANGSDDSFLNDWNMEADRTHAIEQYDQENHPWARIAGQLLGGMFLPAGLEGVGLKAGTDVLRAGGTMAEARAAASIAVRNRLAAISGGYGAGHGALSADNPQDAITGALTEGVTGLATGGLLGEAGRRLGGRLSVDAADTANNVAQAGENVAQNEAHPSEVLAAANRQGINLLPQDVGGDGVKRATAGAAQTTFGAETVRRAAGRTYEAFRNRVLEIGGNPSSLSDVGTTVKQNSADLAGREATRADQTSALAQDALGTPVDATGAGQIIQRGATKWMKDTAKKASSLYDKIEIAPSSKADLSATRDALKQLTTGFKSNSALSKLWAENPRLQATLDALDPQRAGSLSWEDLKRFRSIIGDIIGSPGLESDGAQVAALRKLYAGLSEDMRSTAAMAGPKQLAQFNRANAFYSSRMNRINQTLSRVLGTDNQATPNEAFGAVESALRDTSSGDPAFVGRILRTIPKADADVVRATIINRARGGATFSPSNLAKVWGGLSERAKSALLPQSGLRQIMDDAADRAAASSRDPLANKSGEQVYLSLEKMAENSGDSANFAASLNAMTPEEANSVRSLLIHRLGLADAGQQNAAGDNFSVSKFLTRWNKLSPKAKTVLFGNDAMRSNMNDLALIAERVNASMRLAGHSNTGAVNSFNATTGGLGAAAVALLTGHPIVAAGLAMPALYQRASAELLTSQRFVNWLAKAPKKPNPAARIAHIQRLTAIARSEPQIANEVLQLQQKLSAAFGYGGVSTPMRAAAVPSGDEASGEPGEADRSNAVGAGQQNQQELRP